MKGLVMVLHLSRLGDFLENLLSHGSPPQENAHMPITLEGPYNSRGSMIPCTCRLIISDVEWLEGKGHILSTPNPLLGSITAGVPQGSPTWESGSCWAYRQSPEVGISPWGQSCQSPW